MFSVMSIMFYCLLHVSIEVNSLRTGISKFFCPRATYRISQQFEGRASYVMWLFRDMLHSTKSRNFW